MGGAKRKGPKCDGRGRAVVILRSNPIAPDPRVEKVARALSRAGWQVTIVGWDRSAAMADEEREYAAVFRIRLAAPFASGLRNLPKLVQWNILLLAWLIRYRTSYDVLHACDFDTVLPALVVRFLFNKRVVYDIFDFYADMLRKTPPLVKSLIRWLDFWIMRKVDALILADESRQRQLGRERNKRVTVIYNTPEAIDMPQSNAKQLTRHFSLTIAYVGLLQVERGLLEMLDVIASHPEWCLHLAGFGGDEKLIWERCSRLENVRTYGRVDYSTALSIYAKADVLFATYDPRIPNHKYSSPNKVFEAMMLGKPVIVAKGTGVDAIVERYSLGKVVEYGNRGELERALAELAQMSAEERAKFAAHARRVYEEVFNWEKMRERLVSLYEELISENMQATAERGK